MKKLLKTLLPLGAIATAAIPVSVAASCGNKLDELATTIVLYAGSEEVTDSNGEKVKTDAPKKAWEVAVASWKEKYPELASKFKIVYLDYNGMAANLDVKGYQDPGVADITDISANDMPTMVSQGVLLNLDEGEGLKAKAFLKDIDLNTNAENPDARKLLDNDALFNSHYAVDHFGQGEMLYVNLDTFKANLNDGDSTKPLTLAQLKSTLVNPDVKVEEFISHPEINAPHCGEVVKSDAFLNAALTAANADDTDQLNKFVYQTSDFANPVGNKEALYQTLSCLDMNKLIELQKNDASNKKMFIAETKDWWAFQGVIGSKFPTSNPVVDLDNVVQPNLNDENKQKWSDAYGLWFDFQKSLKDNNIATPVDSMDLQKHFWSDEYGALLRGTWDSTTAQINKDSGKAIWALPAPLVAGKRYNHYSGSNYLGLNSRVTSNSDKLEATAKLLGEYLQPEVQKLFNSWHQIVPSSGIKLTLEDKFNFTAAGKMPLTQNSDIGWRGSAFAVNAGYTPMADPLNALQTAPGTRQEFIASAMTTWKTWADLVAESK